MNKNQIKNIAMSGMLAVTAMQSVANANHKNNVGRDLGAIIGATTGAIIGNEVGRGDTRAVTTILGAVAGAVIGREIGAALDESDRRAYVEAHRSALEGRMNDSYHWDGSMRGSRTGAYGEFTILREGHHRSQRMVCREYKSVIVVNRRQEINKGIACRRSDGSWYEVKSQEVVFDGMVVQSQRTETVVVPQQNPVVESRPYVKPSRPSNNYPVQTVIVDEDDEMMPGQSYSQHNNECGALEGGFRPCRDFYGRFEALKRLIENENGNSDAEGNLDLVLEAQWKLSLNLEYVVDNFIYIQRAAGGANATQEVRQIFRLLMNDVSQKNQLHKLAHNFVKLVQSENGMSDSIGNYSLIMSSVRTGQFGITSGVDAFNSILNAQGGSNSTQEARNAFTMIVSRKGIYSMRQAVASYQALLRAENSASDAIGNFDLVLSAAKVCGSLERATQDFIQVQNQYGGANSTESARSVFRRLYGI